MLQTPTEVTVARGLDSGLECDGGAVAVATYTKASADKASVARIGSTQVDDILLLENKALRWLECRTGRIGTHNRTVKQRLESIVKQFAIVLASFLAYKQSGVVTGT